MTIEGIPKGWELVRISEILDAEFFIDSDGVIKQHDESRTVRMNKNYVIIRKIEKPKQYRPFANAAEFEPHRDRWVKYKGDEDCDESNRAKVVEYSDVAVSINQDADTWKCHFENYTFDDGTPFGVEVQS